VDGTVRGAWAHGTTMWMLWTFQCYCPTVFPMAFKCGPPIGYIDGSTWWVLQRFALHAVIL
jgi:hypothetical protein